MGCVTQFTHGGVASWLAGGVWLGYQPKGNRPEARPQGGIVKNTGIKVFNKFDRNTFSTLRKEPHPIRVLVKTAFALNIPCVEIYKNDNYTWTVVGDVRVRYSNTSDNVLVSRVTETAGRFEEEVRRISEMSVYGAIAAIIEHVKGVKAESEVATYLVRNISDEADWVGGVAENTIEVEVSSEDTDDTFSVDITFSVEDSDMISMNFYNGSGGEMDPSGKIVDMVANSLFWLSEDLKSQESFVESEVMLIPVSKFLPQV